MESLFFDKNLIFETKPNYCNFQTLLDNITFTASVYNFTFFVTDHCEKKIFLYTPDPYFQSAFGKMDKPAPVSHQTIKAIDLGKNSLTRAMIQVAHQIMKSDFSKKNNLYYLSFNVPYHASPDCEETVRLIMFPLLFQEKASHLPWLTYCCAEPINEPIGNFKYKNLKTSESYSVYIHDKENFLDPIQSCFGKDIPFMPTDNNRPDSNEIKMYNFDLLSENNIEILRLSGLGLTETEIAENLGTSTINIKRLKSDMYHLLKIKSTPQAILKLQKQGLI